MGLVLEILVLAVSGCVSGRGPVTIDMHGKPLPALHVGGGNVFGICDEYYGHNQSTLLGYFCILHANPELRDGHEVGPEHEIIMPALPDQTSVLVPGDVLMIIEEPMGRSYGEEYAVASDGSVDLPSLGHVKIAGLNVKKAEKRIEEAYRECKIQDRSNLRLTKVEQSGASASMPAAWRNRRTTSPVSTEYTRVVLSRIETTELNFSEYRLSDVIKYCTYLLREFQLWKMDKEIEFVIDPSLRDDPTLAPMPVPDALPSGMCGRYVSVLEVLKILARLHHFTIEVDGNKVFLKPIANQRPADPKTDGGK